MSLIDPYSSCPCGSGQKFKWCCHKVEPFLERFERLNDGGQVEAANHALDEGLRKVPDNPLLAIKKCLALLDEDQPKLALPTIESAAAKHPGHANLRGLLTQLVVEIDGPTAAVATYQKALQDVPEAGRETLLLYAQMLAIALAEHSLVPAAIKHWALAARSSQTEAARMSAVGALKKVKLASLWLRNDYQPSPPPEGLQGHHRDLYEKALGDVEAGLWSLAADAFEKIDEEADLPEARRNLALCRLWLGDHPGAEEALRSYVPRAEPTEDTVDLEAVRQLIAPPAESDLLDNMRLVWPIRDRDGLIERLRNDTSVIAQVRPANERGPIEGDTFFVLARPQIDANDFVDANDVGRVVGEVLVEKDTVALFGCEDGTLDALSDRFTTLAGPTIPPAHPKTKRLGRISRLDRLMNERWVFPVGVPKEKAREALTNGRRLIMIARWSKTPLSVLGDRTPEQAISAGAATVQLRAAWNLIEEALEVPGSRELDPAYQERLGIPVPPPIDPATVDIDQVHLGRLHRIPADRLDDGRLLALHRRAGLNGCILAVGKAAQAVSERPALLDTPNGLDRFALFRELAQLAAMRQDRESVMAYVQIGRDGDPPELKAARATRWDMLELRLMTLFDPPEEWVPRLHAIVNTNRTDHEGMNHIISELLELGLLRVVPLEDGPEGEQFAIDSRTLQTLFDRYGPRIKTIGDTGTADRADAIWTPAKEAASRGGSTIWTPGSAPQASGPGDPPKVILTRP